GRGLGVELLLAASARGSERSRCEREREDHGDAKHPADLRSLATLRRTRGESTAEVAPGTTVKLALDRSDDDVFDFDLRALEEAEPEVGGGLDVRRLAAELG